MSVARCLLERQRDRAGLAVALDLERQAVAHLRAVDAALGMLDIVRDVTVHPADAIERPHAGTLSGAAGIDAGDHQAAGLGPAETTRHEFGDGLHGHPR